MKLLLLLVLAAVAAFALTPTRPCTVFDRPGPTIAGIIRVGGCP